MPEDIVIVGAGGCAKEILWLLEENNLMDAGEPAWNILGFIDRGGSGRLVDGYPVLGGDEWLLNHKEPMHVACGIGEAALRHKIVDRLKAGNPALIFPRLVSRHAMVSHRAELGEGCIVCAGSIVTCDITMGDFVLINLNCTVCHDTRIGSFVTINPGSNVSGHVTIGSDVQMGTGVRLIPHTQVGDGAVLGAGAVVVRDIPPHCTAVGVPAKPIKLHDV